MQSCLLALSLGYDGLFCDNDIDGCLETSCIEGVECEDVPAPGVGATCGDCPEGYNASDDGLKCDGECTFIIETCVCN